MRSNGCAGFTLVEAMVATTIMAVALATLGQLALASARSVHAARATTIAVLAGRQKLEQLRAAPEGHPALAVSPPGTLHANVAGCHDWLTPAGTSTSQTLEAAFVRRWSVQSVPGGDGALLLQVHVLPLHAGWGRRAAARLVVVKPVEGR
jgi:prepilin-type N-terminal cleavage/methylation domain-containing protein